MFLGAYIFEILIYSSQLHLAFAYLHMEQNKACPCFQYQSTMDMLNTATLVGM